MTILWDYGYFGEKPDFFDCDFGVKKYERFIQPHQRRFAIAVNLLVSTPRTPAGNSTPYLLKK